MSRPLLIVVLVLTFFFYGFAQERDRSKVPEKWKWNLTDLYPSDDAWRYAKERFAAKYPKAEQFRGELRSWADQLRQCLRASI